MRDETGDSLDIRPARAEESASLTRLIRASKAVWGYPQALRARFESELTVTPAYIRQNLVLVAAPAVAGRKSEPVGVGALVAIDDDTMEVGLMFVTPGRLRRGVGKALFNGLCDLARARRCRQLKIVSDPHAVGFYRRMGAVPAGEEESTSVAGRMLPVLAFAL